MNVGGRVPLWVKLVYSVLFAGIMYVTVGYGSWIRLLWFSHTALILVFVGVWTEHSLPVSMAAVSVLVFHTIWTVGYGLQLVTGIRVPFEAYMFDPAVLTVVKVTSLFHVVLPVFTVWLLLRVGYDRRALYIQSLWGLGILLLSVGVASPAENINLVYGIDGVGMPVSVTVYRLLLALSLILFIYIPTHYSLYRLIEQ